MGIRETLNKNPSITTGVTAGIVVVAIGVIVWQLMGSGGGPSGSGGVGKAYFSDDDGATYFSDVATKVPPFDHNGKQAVAAMVFQCGDSGKPFVGMLRRYTKEGKAKMEQMQSGKGGVDAAMEDLQVSGVEVKKPKTGEWVKQGDPRSAAVSRVTCPDGKLDGLRSVTPD